MITVKGDEVEISVSFDEVCYHMALLKDLKEYCSKQEEEGASDTVNALTCAIEVMTAFCFEHFKEEL